MGYNLSINAYAVTRTAKLNKLVNQYVLYKTMPGGHANGLRGMEGTSQPCMWQEECGSLVCSCGWRSAASILDVIWLTYVCVYLGECQLQRMSATGEAF